MATMLYRKQCAEIGFAGSMTTILTWVTRSVKIGLGRLRTVNCGRGRYSIAKNACRAIGCFSSSHFHAATCYGEDSKDRKMPHELNDRQMERRQNTCQILLARQKESRSCIGLWQTMKSGSIFRILNARNLGLIPTINIFLKTKSLRMEDDAVHLVRSGGCPLLRAVKTWWNC